MSAETRRIALWQELMEIRRNRYSVIWWLGAVLACAGAFMFGWVFA